MARSRRSTRPHIEPWSDWSEHEQIKMRGVVGLAIEMANVTDRGTVIVMSAMVDNAMESLLRRYFYSRVRSDKYADDLITGLLNDDSFPPIGSPVVRARVLFALGLADADFVYAMQRMFKIRNAFAHEECPSAIGDEEIEEIAKRLGVASPIKRPRPVGLEVLSNHGVTFMLCAIEAIAILKKRGARVRPKA